MGSINETRLDKTQHTGERGDTPTLLLKTGVGLVVVGIGRRFKSSLSPIDLRLLHLPTGFTEEGLAGKNGAGVAVAAWTL